MKSRRDFLRLSALMAAGSMVAPKLISSVGTPLFYGKIMGYQLYSMREMAGKSGIQPVLEAVSKIGFKNLEAAGYDNGKIHGLTPADLKKRAADLGMKCTSSHLSKAYSKEDKAGVMAWWDKAIEAHHELGVKYMVQPSMPINEKSKLDELKTYCDYFSEVGRKTAAAGIAFGYHNHTGEFKKIDGHVILDYMLKNVHKKDVLFELDVYWCHEGGANPAEYLKKYPDQIRLTHIKDAKEIGASGKMDFKAIFDQMNANHVTDWFVEIEEYTNNDAIGGSQQSFDFLNKAPYVK